MILIDPPRTAPAARHDPLNKRELAQFAAFAVKAAGATGSVSVLLTDDDRIRELNRQFRKKNVATDVLSFPPADWGGETGGRQRSAGDLAISLDTAAKQAKSFGHALATEVKVLILHGALHLAGFDHETDSGEMARLENRLRKQFDLPSGLIHRSTATKSRATGAVKTADVAAPRSKKKRGRA